MLLLKAAVADFAQAVEEHGAGQRVLLRFMQLGLMLSYRVVPSDGDCRFIDKYA